MVTTPKEPGIIGQIFQSQTVLIGLFIFVCGFMLLFINFAVSIRYDKNIAYVPEFFLFSNGLYVTIAGARAGTSYVNVKREEITAINNQTAALVNRPTPGV